MDIKEAETGKMFFLQQRNYTQISDKKFLTHFKSVLSDFLFLSEKDPLVLLKECMLKKVVRRMSLRFLPKNERFQVNAGMTLEAALVLPIFLFFILNMFSVMEMLRLYGNVAWAMNTVGGKVSLYGYLQEEPETDVDLGMLGDVAFTYLYFKGEMLDVLGEDYVNSSPMAGGTEGIWFSKSKIMEEDLLEIVAVYEMEVPFKLGPLGKVRVYNSYKSRAWTGYDVAQGKQVYIMETGEVYHLSAECPYVDLSIQKVSFNLVRELKNRSGKYYKSCELCGEKPGNAAWITDYGERYHKQQDCSGIKRTAHQMSEEEAKKQGYGLCSKCRER